MKKIELPNDWALHFIVLHIWSGKYIFTCHLFCTYTKWVIYSKRERERSQRDMIASHVILDNAKIFPISCRQGTAQSKRRLRKISRKPLSIDRKWGSRHSGEKRGGKELRGVNTTTTMTTLHACAPTHARYIFLFIHCSPSVNLKANLQILTIVGDK